MKLLGWSIDGFGHFRDLRQGRLPPGLVLIHGPNEAGKSTLMAFLQFVLFGRERGKRLHALGGGRLGGRLELELDGERVLCERFDDDPPVVVREGRRLVGEEHVGRLLGGTDRRLFQSVYAFSLADLTSLEGLGDQAVRERLFAGAVAGAGRSVEEARRRLAREREALWRPRADCTLRVLGNEIESLDTEIATARRQARSLQDLQREVARLDQAQARLQHQAGEAARRAALAEGLTRAWPHATAAQSARDELAVLTGLPQLDEPAAERFKAMVAAAEHTAQVRASLDEQLQQAQARRDRIQVAEDVLAVGSRIRSLAEAADAARTDAETVQRLDEALPARQVELQATLRKAGLRSVEALQAVDLSHARVVELRQAADGLRLARKAETDLEAAEAASRRAQAAQDGKTEELQAVAVDEGAERQALLVERLLADQAAFLTDQDQLAEKERGLATAKLELEAARASLVPGPIAGARSLDGARIAGLRQAADAWRLAQVTAASHAASHRVQVAAAQTAVERAERSLAAVVLDAQALELGPALDELAAQEAPARVAAATAAETAASLVEVEQEIARAQDLLGPGWNPSAILAIPTDEATRSEAQRLADACRRLTQRAEVLRSQVAEETWDPEPSLESAQEHLNAVQAVLASREALEQAMHQARAYQRPEGAPGQVWLVLLLAVTVLLLLCGVVLGVLGQGPLGALVGGLALLLAAVVAQLWRGRATGGGVGLDPQDEVRHRQAAHASYCQAAGVPVDADVLQLTKARQAAEAGLRRAERAEQTHRLARQLDEAEAEAERALATLRVWCQRLGLRDVPPADEVSVRLASVRDLQNRLKQHDDLQRKLQRHQVEAQTWARTRDQVAARLGLAPGDRSLARMRDRRNSAEEGRRQHQTRTADLTRAQEVLAEVQQGEATVQQAELQALAAEQALRAASTAAGVPAGVALANLPAWLDAFERWTHAVDRHTASREEVGRLAQRVARWQAEVAAVASSLGLQGPPDQVLPEARTRCTAAGEARRTVQALALAVEAARVQVEASQGLLAQARVEVEQTRGAQARWSQALQAIGLPQDLGVEALDMALTALESAHKLWGDLQAEAASRTLAEARMHAWQQEAAAVCALLGQPLAQDLWDAVATVRALEARRLQAEDARSRRSEAHDDVAGLLAQWQSATERAEAAALDLHAALQQTFGDSNPLQVTAAEARALQARQCRERIAAAELSVRELLGRACEDPQVLQRLARGDLAAWQAEAETEHLAAAAARQERDEALATLGRLRGDVDHLETSTDIPEKDARRSEKVAERQVAQERLAVLLLADHLLAQTLVRFRERHAPGVFRAASEHLRTATAGAYQRVEASEDFSDLLLVDADGGLRATDVLSRGTKDLLYLTLRLGLAREQQPGGVVLPLVLDDILVNLDPDRADGVCRVLATEAQARQVLLLTCRPETVALVQRHAPDATVVRLERYAGRSTPVPPAAMAARAAAQGRGAETDRRILDLLRRDGGLLARSELVAQSGLPDAAVTAALSRLREAGAIRTEGQKKGMRYAVAG